MKENYGNLCKEELAYVASQFKLERAYKTLSKFFETQEGLEDKMKEAEEELCPARAFPELPPVFRTEYKDDGHVESFMDSENINKGSVAFTAIKTYLMALKDVQWKYNNLHGYYDKKDWEEK